MYSDTITLFNRRKELEGDVWYPTILKGVDLNIDRGAIVAKYGDQSLDNAILHVKYSEENGNLFITGYDGKGNELKRKYLPPKEWKRAEDYINSITFADGANFDFFCVGEWADEPISDNMYLDGLYNYMNSQYDFCFAITSVARYSVIPHFEVMAK